MDQKNKVITFSTGRLSTEDRCKLLAERDEIFGKNEYVKSHMKKGRAYPQTGFLMGEDYVIDGEIRVRHENSEPRTFKRNNPGLAREGR